MAKNAIESLKARSLRINAELDSKEKLSEMTVKAVEEVNKKTATAAERRMALKDLGIKVVKSGNKSEVKKTAVEAAFEKALLKKAGLVTK